MDKFISQTDSSLKKKKRRWKPKGRQPENNYYEDVSNLLQGINFKRDELIEYLHILQDKFGVLYAKHLVALSKIINLIRFQACQVQFLPLNRRLHGYNRQYEG